MRSYTKLLAAALLLTVCSTLTIAPAHAKSSFVLIDQDGLKKHDIKQYLQDLGYHVQHLEQIPGTCNWRAETSKDGKDYITTVITDCSIIIEHEDIDA